MAKTDLAAFRGVLRDAEGQMDVIFARLARQIGQVVMQAAGPDGTVPVERLPEVQRQAGRLVDAVFVGRLQGKPFDEQNAPLAPYPDLLAEGQLDMIDLALMRQAAILDRYLPEDLQRRLSSQRMKRDAAV
jgi:hypothetical protein